MEKIRVYSQKRTFFSLIFLVGILAALTLVVSSCTLPSLGDLLGSNAPTSIPAVAAASPTPNPTPTTNLPVLQSRSLIVWVPPMFDPNAGTAAGDLFQARLEEFIIRRPQTDIQVRVKSLTGQYGVLESLRITGSAAPLLKPDLVALPRSLMEQAYQEGLIVPLEDVSGEITGADWFDYALDLSHIGQNTVGFPFAGDLLTLAYKNDSGDNPPPDWNALINIQKPLAFPASDPRGLVSLALYQSLGNPLVDDTGSLVLDDKNMLELLTYYQRAQAAGVMPYWLTQFETDQQAWQSYQDRQSTLALAWTSIILGSESPNTSLAAMPTKEGKAFSYATGWVWCLVGSDFETENVAAELAQYLIAEEFLADWGKAAGYLPVQPSALDSWSEMPYYPTLQKLLPIAVLVPDNYLVGNLGPDIRDAVVSVLKDQVTPAAALDVLREEIPAP